MKTSELKEQTTEELKKRLEEQQEGLSNLRFQLATSQLESPIKVRTVRRDIARLKTILREREIAATPASSKAVQNEVKAS